MRESSMREDGKKGASKSHAPRFRDEDEERDFWATHDVVDYFDWDESLEGLLPALTRSTRMI